MVKRERAAVNSSAVHVFDVLRLIAQSEEPLGVSEISRRLSLPGSTIYRALMTLEESGYIVRFQNQPRYELGAMPQLLNRALVHRFKLHASSRPVLRGLAESTGETVSLTVRIGWYGLRLAGVYGSRDIYHRERLGEVAPLHQSLAGRCILAFLPAADRDRYRTFVVDHHPGAQPNDWNVLESQLESTLIRGFDYEELSNDGRAALAYPIRSPQREILASVAINGPVYLPATGEGQAKVSAARDSLEAEVAASPSEFASPFSGVSSDEIVIRGVS